MLFNLSPCVSFTITVQSIISCWTTIRLSQSFTHTESNLLFKNLVYKQTYHTFIIMKNLYLLDFIELHDNRCWTNNNTSYLSSWCTVDLFFSHVTAISQTALNVVCSASAWCYTGATVQFIIILFSEIFYVLCTFLRVSIEF